MSGLASLSSRLTSAQSQLLERSRILSLGLVPSPSSTTSLIRTLTNVRDDLAKAEDEAALERTGLSVGNKKGSAPDLAAIEELCARYDRLVDMLQADDDGRERAKSLVRVKRYVRCGMDLCCRLEATSVLVTFDPNLCRSPMSCTEFWLTFQRTYPIALAVSAADVADTRPGARGLAAPACA